MNNNPSSVIIHDAFVCEVAALPMSLVAVPMEEQKDPEQQVCTCYGQQRPIVMDLKQKGGLYNNQVTHWRNTNNGHEGFGVLELLSDISNRPMMGADLKQMCKELCDLSGEGADVLDNEFDYKQYVPAQEVLTYQRKPGFSVEEMQALGCTVYLKKDGTVRLGFGVPSDEEGLWFKPSMLQADFRVYALLEATLPKIRRNGEYVSEKIISTPFNPLFICFADKEEKAGCIFRPAMPSFKNIVFSKTDDLTVTKVSRWLGGDKVFVRSLDCKAKAKNGTGYFDAMRELGVKESYRTLKEIWHVKDNGKQELLTVSMDNYEVKADNIIFCKSIPDAISAYYHLNALAATYKNSDDLKDKSYHVCFNMGGVSFSAHQYSKMHSFAHRIYTLFPNDADSLREARMIGKKYREIHRAALPDSFADLSGHCYRSRVYQHQPSTVRDFFLVYKMDQEQMFANDYDINRFFLTSIIAALPSSPLKHVAKKDKNGDTKDDYWTVNAATIWEFMASEGYCRVLETGENVSDKIGRFYHLSFPFYDELDRKSMVSVTRQCLRNFAKTIARPDSTDYEKICDSIEKAREINDKSIDGLPVVDIDSDLAYNDKLDYFYFRNCALKITPDSISAVPYDKLGYFISRLEVLPWDFHMPFMGNNVPFTIAENPLYVERKKSVDALKEKADAVGSTQEDKQEYYKELTDFKAWSKIHHWQFDFRGKRIKDLWKPLQVLRGFANEFWQKEKEVRNKGENLDAEQKAVVDAHLANLFFCLGRPLYRFHSDITNSAPYLLENKVDDESKAQGGSGKSTFVNTFMACCGRVLSIDGKKLSPSVSIAKSFAPFIPKFYRVVHVEDLVKNQDMHPFYNYILKDFEYERKFENVVKIPLSKSPGMVMSSNYVIADSETSTMGRFTLCGFSDRFCRDDEFTGQMARNISDIMPDFSPDPELLTPSARNQIIYLGAMGVQFILKYHQKVTNPTRGVINRLETKTFGPGFLDWAVSFLVSVNQKKLFGFPIDVESCFEEYKDEYLGVSEKKKSNYNVGKFIKNIRDYCNKNGYVMNPEATTLQHSGKPITMASGAFRMKTWYTVKYFDGEPWVSDPTIAVRRIRQFSQEDRKVIFIWKKNDPKIPADYEALKLHHAEMVRGIDLMQIYDDDGNPATLTEEEKKRWDTYQDFKQGKRSSPGFSGTIPMGGTAYKPAALTKEEIQKTEEALPF